MSFPSLPAHYHQPGKTAWDAADYATNAIREDDVAGRRSALVLNDCTYWECDNYGSFLTCFAVHGVSHVWIWREGSNVALFYFAGNDRQTAGRRLNKAVKEQKLIDKAAGRKVLDIPLPAGHKERK